VAGESRIHLASAYCSICILMLLHMCPPTAIYSSMRTLGIQQYEDAHRSSVCILLYMYPHTTTYVSAYCHMYYICVLILLHMCPHTATCVLILLHMCPHTATYVFSSCYTCVLILLHALQTCAKQATQSCSCSVTTSPRYLYPSIYPISSALIMLCILLHTTSADVRAVGDTEVLVLSGDDLSLALDMFPGLYKELQKVAQMRFDHVKSLRVYPYPSTYLAPAV
jgi:hypothetical protein